MESYTWVLFIMTSLVFWTINEVCSGSGNGICFGVATA